MVKKVLFLNIFIILGLLMPAFSMKTDSDQESSKAADEQMHTPVKKSTPSHKRESHGESDIEGRVYEDSAPGVEGGSFAAPSPKKRQAGILPEQTTSSSSLLRTPPSAKGTGTTGLTPLVNKFSIGVSKGSPIHCGKFWASSTISPHSSPEKDSSSVAPQVEQPPTSSEEFDEDFLEMGFCKDTRHVHKLRFSPSSTSVRKKGVHGRARGVNRKLFDGEPEDAKQSQNQGSNSILDDSDEALQSRYDETVSLIQDKLKEDLLSYEFKRTLLDAKQIEKSDRVNKSDLKLDTIVLFRDDHILNLIYEGTRSDGDVCRLAGGHFPQAAGTGVINRDSLKQDRVMKVTSVDPKLSCLGCGISYVRFDAKWESMAASSSSSSIPPAPHSLSGIAGISGASCSSSATPEFISAPELIKESTTFPEGIKTNFHRYVRCLFELARGAEGVVSQVRLLSHNLQSDQHKTVCLFRHKVTFFNGFLSDGLQKVNQEHDHDIYVSMVIFNEDGVDVIWTCYLLGVFIVDWNKEINEILFDDSSSTIEIVGVRFAKNDVKQKIYDARVGNRRFGALSDGRTEYSFQDPDDSRIYNLVGLGNGVYLKIENEVFMRIARDYEKEIKVKIEQARYAKKIAKSVERLRKKAARNKAP